jgi:hypothetical protein
MNEPILSCALAFVAAQRGLDETTVLAQAVREGIRALYSDTIIEAYLSGSISREHALKELGTGALEEVEYQRDALKGDVVWGFENA